MYNVAVLGIARAYYQCVSFLLFSGELRLGILYWRVELTAFRKAGELGTLYWQRVELTAFMEADELGTLYWQHVELIAFREAGELSTLYWQRIELTAFVEADELGTLYWQHVELTAFRKAGELGYLYWHVKLIAFKEAGELVTLYWQLTCWTGCFQGSWPVCACTVTGTQGRGRVTSRSSRQVTCVLTQMTTHHLNNTRHACNQQNSTDKRVKEMGY